MGLSAGGAAVWLVTRRPIRRLLWKLSRIMEDQDLSIRVRAALDPEACAERARSLRRRGVRVGQGTLIGRASFDARAWALEIGNRCAILDDCVIVAHDVNGLVFGDQEHVSTVRILDNSVLLPGVYVMPGVTIGPNAVVAPRSVVLQDVPPNSYAGGHPSRRICGLDEWLAELERRADETPSLFTLIPSAGGFREELMQAWRAALATDAEAPAVRTA